MSQTHYSNGYKSIANEVNGYKNAFGNGGFGSGSCFGL
jgi:hypothetical protein